MIDEPFVSIQRLHSEEAHNQSSASDPVLCHPPAAAVSPAYSTNAGAVYVFFLACGPRMGGHSIMAVAALLPLPVLPGEGWGGWGGGDFDCRMPLVFENAPTLALLRSTGRGAYKVFATNQSYTPQIDADETKNKTTLRGDTRKRSVGHSNLAFRPACARGFWETFQLPPLITPTTPAMTIWVPITERIKPINRLTTITRLLPRKRVSLCPDMKQM